MGLNIKEKIGYIKNILKEKPCVVLTISGNSMAPLIEDKDKILVLKGNSKEISYGDIILYQIGKRLLAHRIVYLKREKEVLFRTKGDANIGLDDIFPQKGIIGKVIAIQKGRRWLFINNKAWGIINKIIAIYSLKGFKGRGLFYKGLKTLLGLSLFFIKTKEWIRKLQRKNEIAIFKDREKAFVITSQEKIYMFNPIGEIIWRMISEKKSMDEIVARIQEDFGLKKEVVKNDIANFLCKIEKQGLVMAKK
ncbi:MAG: PqqD family peptide modification chaperone [bacterium]